MPVNIRCSSVANVFNYGFNLLYSASDTLDFIFWWICLLDFDYMTYDTFLGYDSIIYKKNDEVMNLDWNREWDLYKDKFEMTDGMRTKVDKFFTNIKSGKELYARLNVDHEAEKSIVIKPEGGHEECILESMGECPMSCIFWEE